MPLDEFQKSVDQLAKWIKEKGMGRSRQNLTIQYLGGELLTIPPELMAACVQYARATLSPLFAFFRDGAQTNLIGSPDRVANLVNLFGPDRIGTSVDSFTEQRKVKGSTQKYRTIVLKNQTAFKAEHGAYVPGILVVDKFSLPHLSEELAQADARGYHLTLRPVFEGGSSGVMQASVETLIPSYVQAFRAWALKQQILVQPFYQLLSSRIGERFEAHQDLYTYNTGCPCQHDCAYHSLDLEPNGDVYVCMDMADSHQLPLGNALTGHFDHALWQRLAQRTDHLDATCKVCPYRLSCQGGCMSEAIHHHGDPFGKTEYCILWKALFAEVDALLDREPLEKIVHWLKFVANKHTPKAFD